MTRQAHSNHSNAKRIRTAAHDMSSAAHDMTSAVRDTVRDIPSQVKTLHRQVAGQASDQLEALSDAATDCVEQGREQILSVGQSLEQRVRRQPLQALLIAFGVGAVAALMMRNRS